MKTIERPSKNDSPEVRERAVKMVLEPEADYECRWSAIRSIASKIGCHPKTSGLWLSQATPCRSSWPGTPSEEQARIKASEQELRELRQANEIPRKASAYFAQAELDRRSRLGQPLSMSIERFMGSSQSVGY